MVWWLSHDIMLFYVVQNKIHPLKTEGVVAELRGGHWGYKGKRASYIIQKQPLTAPYICFKYVETWWCGRVAFTIPLSRTIHEVITCFCRWLHIKRVVNASILLENIVHVPRLFVKSRPIAPGLRDETNLMDALRKMYFCYYIHVLYICLPPPPSYRIYITIYT